MLGKQVSFLLTFIVFLVFGGVLFVNADKNKHGVSVEPSKSPSSNIMVKHPNPAHVLSGISKGTSKTANSTKSKYISEGAASMVDSHEAHLSKDSNAKLKSVIPVPSQAQNSPKALNMVNKEKDKALVNADDKGPKASVNALGTKQSMVHTKEGRKSAAFLASKATPKESEKRAVKQVATKIAFQAPIKPTNKANLKSLSSTPSKKFITEKYTSASAKDSRKKQADVRSKKMVLKNAKARITQSIDCANGSCMKMYVASLTEKKSQSAMAPTASPDRPSDHLMPLPILTLSSVVTSDAIATGFHTLIPISTLTIDPKISNYLEDDSLDARSSGLLIAAFGLLVLYL